MSVSVSVKVGGEKNKQTQGVNMLLQPGNNWLAYDIINTTRNTAPRSIKRQQDSKWVGHRNA